MKSSSLHRLNADGNLSPARLRLWHLFNRINNSVLPGLHGRHLEVRRFQADTSGEVWSQTAPRSEPVEKLCDLFWLQLPWDQIVTELGALHVFETQCGAGGLAARIQILSGGHMAGYTGCDTQEHPDWYVRIEENPNVRFIHQAEPGHALLIPERTNLLVSQGALHRLEDDLTFFHEMRDFVAGNQRELIQIHLFPSRIGLRLYGRQGVRQYTPRTVSLITRLFKEFSYAVLFALGGRTANASYWKNVMAPRLNEDREDLREQRMQEYDRQLRQALAQDNRQPSGEPSYYALVIHSHFQRRIFD
jgi:hypothetical protein